MSTIYLLFTYYFLSTGVISSSSSTASSSHNNHNNTATAAAAVETVLQLAEKYFDRADAVMLLELLPPHTPIASLMRYCQLVIEYGSVKKRNLQVCCHILTTSAISGDHIIIEMTINKQYSINL